MTTFAGAWWAFDTVASQPIERLRAEGRRLVDPAGRPFIWRGLTGFRAVELVASGRAADAEAFFSWAQSQDVTIVRVLTMAANLFHLAPEAGAAALPATLDLAADFGLYLEVVGLADTASFQFDVRAHIEAIGAVCAARSNALVEIANEPRHPTQDPRLADPSVLLALRSAVPASVPVALGAAHGADDESEAYVGGDYVTVHSDRRDGDSGWRWVRHINEHRALSERIRKFVVNDEPRRDDLARDKHLAVAFFCRANGLGDTFHYSAGLNAEIATGAELEALAARRRGWMAIPSDFFGSYRNVGFIDSPVRSADFTTVVRVYSSVRSNDGYVIGLGVAPGGPRVDWSPAWPNRELLAAEGGTALWRVWR